MKYDIYTDGACNHKNKRIASAFLIITRNSFISLGVKKFASKNSKIAETVAVGMALECLMREVKLKPDDNVIIYTDSVAVLEFFRDVKREETILNTRDAKVKLAWDLIKELDTKCKWEFRKIKAHRDGINGNKVADRLAKHALRAAV